MKICEICGGPMSYQTNSNTCLFCNKIRTSGVLKNSEHHICECNTLDRKHCPRCMKPCHHDSSLNPKILISPI